MKKFLLSSACMAIACCAFGSLPTAVAIAPDAMSVSPESNKAKMPAVNGPKKITVTPATEWGEWSEAGTSTVTFPSEEFLYTGTAENVPTFLRFDANDATHMQYRFDGLLTSNTVADVLPEPLYVDVYGDEVTVYAQQLPPISLGEYDAYYPGPFFICDWAVLYDMESMRQLNQYQANPMSMTLNLTIFDESQGEFDGLISMGNVDIKLNADAVFSIPSSCVIGGDMGMGLLKVEANETVWSINYAIVKGDGNTINLDTFEFDSVINRIINKDENLMIMSWMAGDIMAVPMEGPGVYTLGAVAYDENENVLATATCSVYNMQNESWNWTSLGQAKVSEDFLREVFSMNLDNAGISHDSPVEYDVEIQESNATPGLYRLVNMYGPSHPYSPIFEYMNDFDVYTYIDCTNPQYCYIYNMPTGFIVKGDKSGEFKLGCEPSVYFEEGFPFDFVAEDIPGAFGKLENGVITFTPEQMYLSVPVYQEALGYDWFPATMFTSNNFTVQLPSGSGIKALPFSGEDATYYDMNGNRVENPVKGGMYILRNAEKTVKIVK